MAGIVSNNLRDQLITAFRERVCLTVGAAPFLHQREVWAASDGLILTGEETDASKGLSIRCEDGSIIHSGYAPRAQGRARFLADLGAFKIGKSYGAALWASGFAAVPGALVSLVGLEYDVCAPEFSYLVEFLLSQRGMNLKAESLQNRPRDGKMWLDLPNGCRYEARSWERKDTLKGKENDAYVYCEAYMLPGIECFTGFSQNLRARRGYAYFATTPDRPWIKLLHELGHGADPEWHCTCSIPADANPYTFDPVAKKRDVTLMTKEKYAIHYEGQLGDFVGRVFNYQRGNYTFTPVSHPALFLEAGRTGIGDRDYLRVPSGWEIVGGVDTGTFTSGLLVAFDPDGIAYVLDEFPNYRYIAGSPERDESLTIPEWARGISQRSLSLGGRTAFWADPNSQFKGELRNYSVNLLPAKAPVETRTEITREYFEHKRILLAPWLSVLPFELENGAWPEEASAAGKFARIKDRDHTLDCLEHILARRPFGRIAAEGIKKGSWAAGMGYKSNTAGGNIHLGNR
jgi:hypothetical protein